MAPKIERVTESSALGEGPHWDAETQSLYYVDIYGKNIVKYDPATNQLSKASVAPKQVSIIIPVQGKKDQFLVSLNNDLAIISWDGKSEKVSILETLHEGDNSEHTKNHIFNDGKCDLSGRIWIGTIASGHDKLGSIPANSYLYSLDSDHGLKQRLNEVIASNGLAFNEREKKLYYIDTAKGTIDQFDYDVDSGSVSNRQILFTVSKHVTPGFPDGMTIDTDGNLWVALFNGGKVIKIAGNTPETLLDVVDLPAIQVTSVAFGGPNLDELYVTTGSVDFEGVKAPPPPANGATYRITGTGSKGYPGVGFKLD